jgi:hypothetical protein
MDLSLLDRVLWATGFSGHIALLSILVARGRVRGFPLFTLYIAYQIVTTMVLFATYREASARVYAVAYWDSAALDFALLLGVLAEIAYIVFRPATEWVQHSRGRLIGFGLAAILLAAGLSVWVHPSGSSLHALWRIRENLFTSIVTCELFTVILLTSQRLGLHWRSHVMHLGYGLTVWALMCFFVEGLHAYWGRGLHFTILEHVRMFAYLGTLFFWIGTFWRDEPKRTIATAEMQRTALLLSSRLSYDLAAALDSGKKVR